MAPMFILKATMSSKLRTDNIMSILMILALTASIVVGFTILSLEKDGIFSETKCLANKTATIVIKTNMIRMTIKNFEMLSHLFIAPFP
jgi:hypothetical protein